MTTPSSNRPFRLLALGGAKARTNDDTGDLRIEHDEVRYNFP